MPLSIPIQSRLLSISSNLNSLISLRCAKSTEVILPVEKLKTMAIINLNSAVKLILLSLIIIQDSLLTSNPNLLPTASNSLMATSSKLLRQLPPA